MDSIALAAYLDAEYAELLAETGIEAAYVVSIVAEVYAAEPDLDTVWAAPLADYYLWRRAVRWAEVQFDLSTEGDSYQLGKRVERWAKRRDEAEARVTRIVNAGTSTRGRVVTLVTDYLTGEPS